MRNERTAGIDLGATEIHVVLLAPSRDERSLVEDARAFASDELPSVVEFLAAAARIAIDAPDQLSTAPHAKDTRHPPKFRTARCGEIALGELAGIWVPWTTPVERSSVAPWMQVGFRLWSALRGAGHEPVETYPSGVFQILAGARLPKKSTQVGLQARRKLLAEHVELPTGVDMWRHDGIDALAAALVASWFDQGKARGCAHTDKGCDRSAIWMPVGALRR